MNDMPSPVVNALLEAVLQGGDTEKAITDVQIANAQTEAVATLGPCLQDTHGTPVQTRNTIVNVLFRLGDLSATQPLAKALSHDPDPGVRHTALGTLEVMDPRGSLLLFQQALADKETNIQQAALVSLGIAIRYSVLAVQDDTAQKQAVQQQLSQIKLENLAKLLNRETRNQEENLRSIAAASALGIVGGSDALRVLCQFLQDELALQAQFETADGQTDEERTRESERAELRTQIAVNVVYALREVGMPEAVPCLGATLRRNVNAQVRQLTAVTLGKLPFTTIVEPLFQATLLDQSPKVQHAARDALTRFPDWQEKARQLLRTLDSSPLQRGQLEAMALIETIRPDAEALTRDPHLLTNFLIAQALDHTKNERLLSLCASLIIASANGSLTLAGECLDVFRRHNAVTEEQLRPLRVEIGGARALSPLLAQLEENLKIYFQEPIKALNEDTQHVWRQTLRIAQIGFALRSLMSVTLFIIGAYLVIHSYHLFTTGTLDIEGFFGPGVAFVTGLATMLTMVYTGPLRDIRKSVSDVGAADAAFMAYIHRLLQVSHTFSYYYLEGKASFDELKTAGDLIEDMLTETVKIIRLEDNVDGR